VFRNDAERTAGETVIETRYSTVRSTMAPVVVFN
jgi:hypothetical protein